MVETMTAASRFLCEQAELHALITKGNGSIPRCVAIARVRPEQIGSADRPAADAAHAIARLERGRWIADCPDPICSGAEDVEPGWPFLCGSCFNVGSGYLYRLVDWTSEFDDINAAMRARLRVETANWFPGETVKHLLDENVRYILDDNVNHPRHENDRAR